MLIYDLISNGEHELLGTLGNVPDFDNDNDVSFITIDGDLLNDYLRSSAGEYTIVTRAGRLFLRNNDGETEFYGMVDGVVVVGKATEADIVLNDVEHMHFAIDSERPYVIGQSITLRAIPDDEWMISPLDDEEDVYAVINGERFPMELLDPDTTWSVDFVIKSDLVEIELDGKVEYDQE